MSSRDLVGYSVVPFNHLKNSIKLIADDYSKIKFVPPYAVLHYGFCGIVNFIFEYSLNKNNEY